MNKQDLLKERTNKTTENFSKQLRYNETYKYKKVYKQK